VKTPDGGATDRGFEPRFPTFGNSSSYLMGSLSPARSHNGTMTCPSSTEFFGDLYKDAVVSSECSCFGDLYKDAVVSSECSCRAICTRIVCVGCVRV
jgi:hypothetical protein